MTYSFGSIKRHESIDIEFLRVPHLVHHHWLARFMTMLLWMVWAEVLQMALKPSQSLEAEISMVEIFKVMYFDIKTLY